MEIIFLTPESKRSSRKSGTVVTPCFKYLGSKNKATITSVTPEPTYHPITLILLL